MGRNNYQNKSKKGTQLQKETLENRDKPKNTSWDAKIHGAIDVSWGWGWSAKNFAVRATRYEVLKPVGDLQFYWFYCALKCGHESLVFDEQHSSKFTSQPCKSILKHADFSQWLWKEPK